ncbi:hypothetical protein ACRZ5S_17960 [Vibrio scophthalmi]|uniref:hypothetical protein n=1 Tax=Vibrio scophthalmi TaxID=45658 RepID=UPI003EB9098D
MSLFIHTQKLTLAKEDHLTEFFAASLNASDMMKSAFVRLVFGNDSERRLIKVETQSIYPNARPDMKLTFDDDSILLCENKLDAMETIGNEHTDFAPQLERYLHLPVNGVMYIRSSWKSPSQQVLAHPKYIKPYSKPHFLWRDFYPMLVEDTNPLVKELKLGFEKMGFMPPNPIIGDLSREAPRKQRENFSLFWLETSAAAINLGWNVNVGDVVERYFTTPNATFVNQIYINPIKPERFLVRLTPEPGMVLQVMDKVRMLNPNIQPDIKQSLVTRVDGDVSVIDIEAPISSVLPDSLKTVAKLEAALFNYVMPYLKLNHQNND